MAVARRETGYLHDIDDVARRDETGFCVNIPAVCPEPVLANDRLSSGKIETRSVYSWQDTQCSLERGASGRCWSADSATTKTERRQRNRQSKPAHSNARQRKRQNRPAHSTVIAGQEEGRGGGGIMHNRSMHNRSMHNRSMAHLDDEPAAVCAAEGKRHFFLEFSLCLSRACLGKMLDFIYKLRKKCRFLTYRSMSTAGRRRRCLQPQPAKDAPFVPPQ